MLMLFVVLWLQMILKNMDAGELFKDLTHFLECLVFAHTSKLIWSIWLKCTWCSIWCKNLLQLISSQIFSEDILPKHSFSFDSNISLLHYHDMVLKKSTSSLVYLVNIKVISKIIIKITHCEVRTFFFPTCYWPIKASEHYVLRLLHENTCKRNAIVISNKKIIGNLLLLHLRCFWRKILFKKDFYLFFKWVKKGKNQKGNSKIVK